MKHRQFKTECICMVTINGKTSTCNELRGVKNKIYTQGIRGEKFVGNFKIKITDEESEEYYNALKEQHNEGGIKTHKDDIKEIIIKKLQNRRDKNKKRKAQRLFELYGKELRKTINNNIKLARDIEEFKRIYEEEKYFLRV